MESLVPSSVVIRQKTQNAYQEKSQALISTLKDGESTWDLKPAKYEPLPFWHTKITGWPPVLLGINDKWWRNFLASNYKLDGTPLTYAGHILWNSETGEPLCAKQNPEGDWEANIDGLDQRLVKLFPLDPELNRTFPVVLEEVGGESRDGLLLSDIPILGVDSDGGLEEESKEGSPPRERGVGGDHPGAQAHSPEVVLGSLSLEEDVVRSS